MLRIPSRASMTFFALLALSLCLAGPARAAELPGFEPVACPDGVSATECGYVTVPENRSRPGRTIRLFTMVVRSSHPQKQPDPLFFLSGGPGEKATPYASLAEQYPDRDFVTFDQRGNGYSQPALECPDYFKEVARREPGLAPLADRLVEALQTCGSRYRRRGIDLGAYNATESASDIENIRQVLGYDRINLLGLSYGTRLAQEYMRRYSEHLRAVVLDSVVPAAADRSADTPRSAEAALQRVFAACAADSDCASYYPNLAMRFSELVSHLDAAGGVADEQTEPLTVQDLLAHVFLSLYSTSMIGDLPSLIYRLHSGQLESRRQIDQPGDGQAFADFISWGSFFAVECSGEIASSRPEALLSTYEQLPHWRVALGDLPGVASLRIREICHDWGLDQPSGHENEPLRSDVPTLLLGGEFDPVTPPPYLALAAEGLSQAYPIVLPGQSHGVTLANRCGLSLAQAFIADPGQAPDASCAAALTPFFFLMEDE